MRKILLATTSLMAISVTAAQADLSISGSYEFGYYQTSAGTNSTGSDGNITFSGTGASENGVTYSVVANNGIQTGSVEDAYLQMAGDFGTLRLGFTDSMVDTNDGVLGKSQFVYGMNDISTEIEMDTGGVNDETVAAFHYQSAELVPGLTAYGSVIPNGVTGYGIKYSNDIATVIYQIAGGGGTDQTLVGVGFNVGGFGINAGSLESTTAAVKTTTSDFAVSYSFGDIGIVAGQIKQGAKSYDSVGATYTIAPGVGLAVENYANDDGTTETSGTGAWLTVSF